MKTLILVRHAKSSWDYPHLSDFDRPLNKRGKRDTPRMADYLVKQGIQAEHFVSSPAKRAIVTAKTIWDQQLSMHSIIEDQRLYHASSSEILSVVREQETGVTTMMIFGHNPGFTDCANRLASTSIDNIPTCGVVGIRFEVNSWNEVNFGGGSRLFLLLPKTLNVRA